MFNLTLIKAFNQTSSLQGTSETTQAGKSQTTQEWPPVYR